MWVLNQKQGDWPPKWMVKTHENPIKIDDLGVPLFLWNTQIIHPPVEKKNRFEGPSFWSILHWSQAPYESGGIALFFGGDDGGCWCLCDL